MIAAALRDYLVDLTELTGHPAELFESQQQIGERRMTSRNDARRYLRDLIGDRVFAGRIPQRQPLHGSVTIRQIVGTEDQPLVGELGSTESLLQIDAFCRGVNADSRAEITGQLIRIAIANYHGYWGETFVSTVIPERGGLLAQNPRDGSDDWSFAWSADYRIIHDRPGAIYPLGELIAVASLRYGTSSGVVCSAANSVVPTGRSLSDVQWSVIDSLDAQLSWGGPPAEVSTEPGVEGTNLEALITGLTPPLSVTLTVTDTNGDSDVASIDWP